MASSYGAAAYHLQRLQQQQQSQQQCLDPSDMDSWLDFNSVPSPTPASMSRKGSHIPSAMTSPTSTILPLDVSDDHQTPVQPTHDYGRYRQTTGIPINSLNPLPTIGESSQMGAFSGFSNTGFDDLGLGLYTGGMGSNTGLDFILEEPTAMPQLFYPGMPTSQSQSDDFVDPTAISNQQESQANVRFYPGMHQQQAALAKAQQQAMQQKAQQEMMQAQQRAREEHAQRQAHRKSVDPRTEETIARVMAQIRQNSGLQADGLSADNLLPHVARMKKDEEDMDEDERLLNSEEGKKLSSKERRQLRNKVSARAFRSRRKEYIGQLEGEVAVKVNEAHDLKIQNRALLEENARFRALAEKLLAHPAFHPFLEDLSRDPELAASLSKVTASTASSKQQQQQADLAAMGGMPAPAPLESQHIGMALMPEPVGLDFAGLSLGSNNWGVPAMGMPTFQQSSVFAVTEIETPCETEISSYSEITGKGESVLDRFMELAEDSKASMPELDNVKVELREVETAAVEATTAASYDFDESDESCTLFAASSASTKPTVSEEDFIIDLPLSLSGKLSYTLVVASDSDRTAADQRLSRLISRMERISSRVSDLTRGY